MGTYRLSIEAGQDVIDIEDSTARRWGDTQAESYIHALFAAFERLADDPQLGRRRNDVPAPYLVYAVQSHLVVYRVRDDVVEILNILHPAMDIEARLDAALRRMASNQ